MARRAAEVNPKGYAAVKICGASLGILAGRNDRFQALVNRYPKSERAIGFLIAKGISPDEP